MKRPCYAATLKSFSSNLFLILKQLLIVKIEHLFSIVVKHVRIWYLKLINLYFK